MASVQELILAAQAQAPRSPVADLINSFNQGFIPAFNDRPNTALKLAQLRQMEEETERKRLIDRERAETNKLLDKRIQEGGAVEISVGPSGVTKTTGLQKEIPKTFESLIVQRLAKGEIDFDTAISQKRELESLASNKNDKDAILNWTKTYISQPEIKNYNEIKTKVRTMDSSLEAEKRGDMNGKLALDQALITVFNKALDPESVVRESEYARTPENLSAVNRVVGSVQKFTQGGGGLTMEDREDLVLAAKIIGNEFSRAAKEAQKGFIDVADTVGIDSTSIKKVTGDIIQFDITPRKKPKINNGINNAGPIDLGGGYSFEEIR